MVSIWELLQQRGVRWSQGERERRLFPVCVQVQARLLERYPDYTVPQVHVVPEALVDEVKEMLGAIFSEDRGPDPGASGAAVPL